MIVLLSCIDADRMYNATELALSGDMRLSEKRRFPYTLPFYTTSSSHGGLEQANMNHGR